VKINVQFACSVREGRSDIIDSAGKSQGLGEDFSASNQYNRNWDGKKLYGTGSKAIGTYMVEDGEYRHRLEKVKFGFLFKKTKRTKKSEDQFATGPWLISKPIKVKSRAHKGTAVDHFHYTAQNADDLAAILEQEVSPSVVNDSEHKAIAWAVRNQMV